MALAFQQAPAFTTTPGAAPTPLARKGLALSAQLAILTALLLIALSIGVLMLRVMGRRATAKAFSRRNAQPASARRVNPWVESGRRLTDPDDSGNTPPPPGAAP